MPAIRWPFGRAARTVAPEAKQSAAGPLIAFSSLGRPKWTPRDYAYLAVEGFQKNPVAYRCIRMIAEAAASAPFAVFVGGRREDDHPLARLEGAAASVVWSVGRRSLRSPPTPLRGPPPPFRCASRGRIDLANGARGEVGVMIGGEARRLCLTLGALAEIETGLGVAGLAGLAERMRALSARDLILVLKALLKGGGEAGEVADGADPREAAVAVARAFEAAAG